MRRIIAWVPCAFISNVSSSNPFGFTSARLRDLDGTIANFLQTDIIDVIGNAATSGIDTIILSHPEGLGDGSGVTGVGGNGMRFPFGEDVEAARQGGVEASNYDRTADIAATVALAAANGYTVWLYVGQARSDVDLARMEREFKPWRDAGVPVVIVDALGNDQDTSSEWDYWDTQRSSVEILVEPQPFGAGSYSLSLGLGGAVLWDSVTDNSRVFSFAQMSASELANWQARKAEGRAVIITAGTVDNIVAEARAAYASGYVTAVSPSALADTPASEIIKMPVPLPNVGSVGVPVADQLARAPEIAAAVSQQLLPDYCAAVAVDDTSYETTIPEANRVYIAATGTAGNGIGTLADPIQVNSGSSLDTAALRTAIADAVTNRTGDVAVMLDNAIDTGEASAAMTGIAFGSTGDDIIALVAWDRSGVNPDRVPVFDGFRPVEEFVTGFSAWSDDGGGVYSVVLDVGTTTPRMLRLGPAGQHIHTSDIMYQAASLAAIDGSAFSEHRFFYDAATRTLSVRLADGSDPGLSDVRLSVQTAGCFRFGARRSAVLGLRVSGYDAAGSGNNGYNIGFASVQDSLHFAYRLRTDFALRHAHGMAFGGPGAGTPSLWVHVENEFGTGIDDAGYTPDVCYAHDGGCHLVGVRPTFVDGTINRGVATATIVHSNGAPETGSAIYIAARAMAADDGGSFRAIINHSSKAADCYSLTVGAVLDQDYKSEREVEVGVFGNHAYIDANLDYQIEAQQDFAGVQIANSWFAKGNNSRLTIGGPFADNPSSGTEFGYLHSRGGPNNFASNGPAEYDLAGCVLDTSTFTQNNANGTGFFRSSSTDFGNVTEPMLRLSGCMVRAPGTSAFRWFSNGNTAMSLADADLADAQEWTDCAFVGTFPANQTPASGVTAYTEGEWAALDPTALSDNLATAWLIDQEALQPAARSALRATLRNGNITIPADSETESGRCRTVVSVTGSATPSDADLVAGIWGAQIDPLVGGVVDVRATSGNVWAMALDPTSEIVRSVTPLGAVTQTIGLPRIVSVVHDEFGLKITFDRPVTRGSGFVASSVRAVINGIQSVTPTYTSGDGTETMYFDWSSPIDPDATVVVNHNQPGDGLEAVSDGLDVESGTGIQSRPPTGPGGGVGRVARNARL